MLLLAVPCAAQNWELGAAGAYGFYRTGTIFSPNGNATAGIRDRFGYSLLFGEDLYKRLGGEFRFTYQDGDPFLSAGTQEVNVQGYSHAFHYDLLFHFRPKEARVRPYIAGGGGVKRYVVNSPQQPFQPLGNIAILTRTDEVKALLTAGFGVKFRLSRNALVRLDFRDYITAFPKEVIAPVPLGNARGIMHMITPMAGVSLTF